MKNVKNVKTCNRSPSPVRWASSCKSATAARSDRWTEDRLTDGQSGHRTVT